jgi:hypothetical protein
LCHLDITHLGILHNSPGVVYARLQQAKRGRGVRELHRRGTLPCTDGSLCRPSVGGQRLTVFPDTAMLQFLL